MNKWLFWGAIALAGFWIWKLYDSKKKRQVQRAARENKPESEQGLLLVLSCAHCGLHLPKSEALEKNGQWYCSKQHALAGPRP